MLNYYKYRDEVIKRTKDKILSPITLFLYKTLGLSSDSLTKLSFFSGVLAAFFMFKFHSLFILFLVLSVFLDVFDGAVARIEKKKNVNWLIDVASDRAVCFVILLHIVINTPSQYNILILIFYALVKGLYILGKYRDENLNMLQTDYVYYILFIFGYFKLALIIIPFLLVVNLLEIFFQFIFRAKKQL